jgi:hypothetical protein
MTEEQLRLMSRLIKTQEGRDFVEEILKPMLKDNHQDLLTGNKNIRDEMIGFGNCLLALLTLFETCDIKLATQAQVDIPSFT